MAMSHASRPALYWPLAGLCGMLILVELLLLARLLLGSEQATYDAFDRGQRVFILPESGDIISALMPDVPEYGGETALPSTLPANETDALSDATSPLAPEGQTMAPPVAATPSAPEINLDEFVIAEENIPDDAVVSDIMPPAEALSTDSMVGSDEELLRVIPMEPRTAASLAAVDPALLEASEAGDIPVRSGDRTPFTAYQRPFTPPAEKTPLIAIIITELGAQKAPTELATSLPPDVTLAFSPYAKLTPEWMQTARNRGYESWLMLPAQPDTFPASDGGPLSLLVEQPPEEAQTRFTRLLARVKGYPGLVLPTGEIWSDHSQQLSWLGPQLQQRGLALIAAQAPDNSTARGWFRSQPYAMTSQRLVDASLNEAEIRAQLSALEQIAGQQGKALGVIRPYPLSLTLLQEWLAGLKAHGFVLAPASALLMAEE